MASLTVKSPNDCSSRLAQSNGIPANSTANCMLPAGPRLRPALEHYISSLRPFVSPSQPYFGQVSSGPIGSYHQQIALVLMDVQLCAVHRGVYSSGLPQATLYIQRGVWNLVIALNIT